MLEFKRKMELDPEVKRKYDEEGQKPVPKPKWKKIEQSDIQQMSEMEAQRQKIMQKAAYIHSSDPEKAREAVEHMHRDHWKPWDEFKIPKPAQAQ